MGVMVVVVPFAETIIGLFGCDDDMANDVAVFVPTGDELDELFEPGFLCFRYLTLYRL